MKAKVYLLLLIVASLAACNTNEPEKKELIGTWSELSPINNVVKTITFKEDGSLTYFEKPTTEITWPGICAKLNYSVTREKMLCFSGDGISYKNDSSVVDTISFMFLSNYSIKSNILTIDSFAYDGGLMTTFVKPLILKKQ